MIKRFDAARCVQLLQAAAASPRLRSHELWHQDHQDPVQRMLIAAQPGTYFRPHYHTAQWEVLQIVHGVGESLLFSPDGVLTERIRLQAGDVLELPAGQCHALNAIEAFCFFEVKPGPFAEAVIPAWAPEENSALKDAARDWLATAAMGSQLNLV